MILKRYIDNRQIHVSAAVILRTTSGGEKQIFATQRGYGEWKDWWEVPGGKIETGETAEQAIVREIREELATEIRPEQKLCTVEYDNPAFHLTMECFLCSVVSGKLTLLEHENSAWLSAEKLESVKWLPADVEVLEKVKELFKD